MRETRIKNERGGSLIKILVIAATLVLCLFGLAYAYFYWTMNTLVARPLDAAGDWIGKIEVEDHGGDYRITLPPAEDGAQRDPG